MSNHDGEGGEGRATNARNREELKEAGNIIALSNDLGLDDELTVDVIQITSCLQRVIAKSEQ